MKISFIAILMAALLVIGCASPKHLPPPDKIGEHPFGSEIGIRQKKGRAISGELIAIDSTQIFVLLAKTKKCEAVPLNNVRRFWLMYAQHQNYGWTIPVFTLWTISHGWFLIFTAPVNLIVTVSVTVSGKNAFTYSDDDMSFNKLKMFARFPQGIPKHISLDSIK